MGVISRYYGKKILYQLMSHQDIDKMLTKYLPANTLRSVQDVVDNLRQKVCISVVIEITAWMESSNGLLDRTSLVHVQSILRSNQISFWALLPHVISICAG